MFWHAEFEVFLSTQEATEYVDLEPRRGYGAKNINLGGISKSVTSKTKD